MNHETITIEKTTMIPELLVMYEQIPDNRVPNKPFSGYCRQKGRKYWIHSSDVIITEWMRETGNEISANKKQFNGGNTGFDYAVEIGSEIWNEIFN